MKNNKEATTIPSHVLAAISAANGWGGKEPNIERLEMISTTPPRKRLQAILIGLISHLTFQRVGRNQVKKEQWNE